MSTPANDCHTLHAVRSPLGDTMVFGSYFPVLEERGYRSGHRVSGTVLGVATTSARRTLAERLIHLSPSANPESLAVMRIVAAWIGYQLLGSVGTGRLAVLPRELWWPPYGTGWMVDLVPVERGLIDAVADVTLVGLVLLALGLWHRLGGLLALGGLFYLGWIPQLTGKVDHYHHVLWFILLVTLFPAADTWSLQAVLRRIRGLAPAARDQLSYALPVLVGMILIALMYFFPGLAKLTTSGLEWALSDNLRNIMYRIWWEQGRRVADTRIDEWPAIYQSVALGALAFELLFLPAVLYRRTRPYAAVAGFLFHFGTRALLGIAFTSLQVMYVVFVDWRSLASRLPWAKEQPTPVLQELRIGFREATTVLLLSLVVIFGALERQDAWPVAAYPRFSAIEEPVVTEIEFRGEDGRAVLMAESGLAEYFGGHRVKPMATVALLRGEQTGGSSLEVFMDLASEYEDRSSIQFCEMRLSRYSSIPGDGRLLETQTLFTVEPCADG